ncbi:hypothetical protein QOZ80_8BG0648030 [Eleusine coracana subsp. coracana]|nr:hypothetical protein QOZ80_8BG0648030 [Eleusine coracana subsp. coracana]
MSNPGRRASRSSQIPMTMPPPHRRSTPTGGGLPFRGPQFVMAPFSSQESQGSFGADVPTALDLLRRGVLPPSGSVPPPSHEFFTDGTVETIEEDFSAAMSSGSYFTNLISDGVIDPNVYAANIDDPQANDPQENVTHQNVAQEIPPQDNVPVVAKNHQKRSKNFSVLLVSAWLNVTLDPIQGVDQSRNTYWKRIHDYFHDNKKFKSDRSQSSLLNRWSGIQHDINVFAGCLAKIEARNHSGWSVDDKVASVCTMFTADDKLHRNFPYMHCWKILKDKPKWMDRRKNNDSQNSKKQKTTTNSSPSSAPLNPAANNDETQSSEGAQERPAGKKKEKQKLWQCSSIEALDYLVAKKKQADAEKDVKKEEDAKKPLPYRKEGRNT